MNPVLIKHLLYAGPVQHHTPTKVVEGESDEAFCTLSHLPRWGS